MAHKCHEQRGHPAAQHRPVCSPHARAAHDTQRAEHIMTLTGVVQGGKAAALRPVLHLEAATVPAVGAPDADPAAQEVRDPVPAAAQLGGGGELDPLRRRGGRLHHGAALAAAVEGEAERDRDRGVARALPARQRAPRV